MPALTRVAVLRDSAQGSGTSQFAVIQAVAPSLRLEINPINTRSVKEIERAVPAFARTSNGGLIVATAGLATVDRGLIVTLAAQHKLPAIYFERLFAVAGGLISYGADYIDHIGARPLMSIASSMARSRLIFRYRRRPSTNW